VPALTWNSVPTLDRPLVIIAFRGMFDAAGAATTAVSWLRDGDGVAGRRLAGERIASIDPDPYFDFQQERPHVRITAEGRRVVDWPENDWYGLQVDGPHDLVLCAGVEPHLRWRSFCDDIIEVATRCGAEMVVTLGAMVGLVPHTRPFPVVGSATNPELAERLGLGQPSYEGPTGVIGTLHDQLDQRGLPVISLRATVPHYVPAPPNPKATRALLRRLEDLVGTRTGHERFDAEAASWARDVDLAAADDAQVLQYVRRLEQQYDDNEPLPSGDDLAAELEAFLREQRDGD
jgi:proteasome assembly chaperone (PAC2) family protein